MVGRFFVQPLSTSEGERGAILIGIGDTEYLKKGHVFEITEDLFGYLHAKDLGLAEFSQNTDYERMGVSELMARAQGKHLTPINISGDEHEQ